MWVEGEEFVDVNAEVFDAVARRYGLVIYCESWIVGEVFCLVSAVMG
jgi:hypothetical protein